MDDIFNLRLPRLQILRNNGSHKDSNKPSEPSTASGSTDATAEEKKVLKREIKSWWQGVAEHMDKLVSRSPVRVVLG